MPINVAHAHIHICGTLRLCASGHENSCVNLNCEQERCPPVCRSFNRKSYTHADTHKRSNNTPVCCCTPPSLCIWRVCVCVCVAAHNAHSLAATTQNARSLAHNRLRMRAFYVCTPRMNELVPVAATAAASAGHHTNADRSHHHHHHYAAAATSARTAAPRIRKLTCAWIGKKKTFTHTQFHREI